MARAEEAMAAAARAAAMTTAGTAWVAARAVARAAAARAARAAAARAALEGGGGPVAWDRRRGRRWRGWRRRWRRRRRRRRGFVVATVVMMVAEVMVTEGLGAWRRRGQRWWIGALNFAFGRSCVRHDVLLSCQVTSIQKQQTTNNLYKKPCRVGDR